MKRIPIQVGNRVYPSVTAYSKEVGLSRERIETYLRGQTTLTEKQHQELCELCFKSRNWEHVKDHAKKSKTGLN